MAETKLVKIEIHYDDYADSNLTVKFTPSHYSEFSFWGNPGGVEFPYVVEVTEEEANRIARAFKEMQWAKNRLRILTPRPRPQKCMCGNCPDPTPEEKQSG